MKNEKSGKAALVTGAAAGLGASFADLLAGEGYDVILVDRQRERAQKRADELAKKHGVRTHVMVHDLTKPGAARAIHDECSKLGWTVEILVNNAGFHLNKFLHQLPWGVLEDNMQLLLGVVVELCHRFVPDMIARKSGRIINVASVSGFMPGSVRLATYNSSKTFLIPFTEALSFELAGTGVSATAVCPGFMRTDMFEACGLTDVRDSVPGFMWLDPGTVARQAYRAALRGVPVYVAGIPNRLIVTAAKFVPRKLLRERTRVFHKKAHDALGDARSVVKPPPGRHAALVTGATAGIGRSFSEVLAREGFDVILVARRKEILDARAAELAQKYGVKTHVIVQDLSVRHGSDAIVAACEKLGWPVDVIVNNAGYPTTELFWKMKWEDVERALEILVKSVVKLTHAFLPGMIERGWGRVINVASMAAFEPGSYRSSLYSSAKSSVVAFSESVAAELEGTGVTATAVCPGFTRTEWLAKNGLDSSQVPSLLFMDSDPVAEAGYRDAMRGAPVSVIGTPALRVVSTLFQVAPRHLVGEVLSRKRRSMQV